MSSDEPEPRDDALSAAWALSAAPSEPPRGAKERLLEHVARADAAPEQPWQQWTAAGGSDVVVRGEESFEPTAFPGVEVRALFVDRDADRVTMLVRMAPGSSYPRHVHSGAEECYVLAGDLRAGALVLRTGDYQRVAEGSVHDVQRTDGGCLLLIHSGRHDELMP